MAKTISTEDLNKVGGGKNNTYTKYQYISVDEFNCSGCGSCVEGCPVNGVQIVNGVCKIVDCVNCGYCIEKCPIHAIKYND